MIIIFLNDGTEKYKHQKKKISLFYIENMFILEALYFS